MDDKEQMAEVTRKLKCNMTCDTCGRESETGGVASSTFAAASFMWCSECLKQEGGCEPEFVFEYMLYYVAGKDTTVLHDSILSVMTVEKENKGKEPIVYISFEDWSKKRLTLPDPEWVNGPTEN